MSFGHPSVFHPAEFGLLPERLQVEGVLLLIEAGCSRKVIRERTGLKTAEIRALAGQTNKPFARG